jgi:hypothetical protein
MVVRLMRARQAPRVPMLRARFALAAVFAMSGGAAGAQQLRGEVVLPDSTTRVPGVVVVATGAGGAEVARALTGERGEFFVRFPGAGRYGLRLLRVGFRPTVVEPMTIAEGETRTVRLVLGDRAVTLAAVRVPGENVCRIRQDSGQLVARVWEQARTALSATQLTARGSLLDASLLTYRRVLDRTGLVIKSDSSHIERGTTRQTFQSWSAESLAALGYATTGRDGLTYYAPDADVLLSDSFAALHCFRIEPPPGDRADWVGIGFRPARERRGVNDIEGTLWMDRGTAELRRLEYKYTNLQWEFAEAGAGGWVEFTRLSTGQWIVTSWVIRLPQATRRMVAREGPRTEITAVSVSGGEVLEVMRNGVVLHRAAGSSLEVTLAARDPYVGAEGAKVALAGTPQAGVADSTGRVRFGAVLPGRYTATFVTPVMERLGVPPLEGEVEVKPGVASNVARFRLPTVTDLMRQLCGDVVAAGPDALIFGRLADSSRRPRAGAALAASWQRGFSQAAGGGVRFTTETREAEADEVGRWRMCGMPHETPIFLTVAAEGVKWPTVKVRVPEKWPFARFDLPDSVAKAP